jgi:DNA-binding SARP family transcriptional activator
MTVEFRLLGEIEAFADGRRLDIGHARQRCVLACLLVDVNRAVSADQLINRVWADEPPLRARNALAAYISRLRQTLGGALGPEIERRSTGYLLSAGTQSIDLFMFRDLASQARAAPEPAAAAALFDKALAQWHGEAVSTLDTPWASDLRCSLDAERFSVTLDRNDAALAAGRHAELLGDLTGTLQTHPLDERVAGQVMLALYRSGRQAEALDVYRLMRERLVEELGVDPNPALQAVYQQILGGDSTYPVSQSAPHPVAAAAPLSAVVDPTRRRIEMTTAEVDRELKAKHRALWASGDYPAVAAELIAELGPELVRACGIRAGDQVLDVAAGSGNAAIPAAAEGAIVTASDLTPELFDAGRSIAAEHGVTLEWVEADAEAMPFAGTEPGRTAYPAEYLLVTAVKR